MEERVNVIFHHSSHVNPFRATQWLAGQGAAFQYFCLTYAPLPDKAVNNSDTDDATFVFTRDSLTVLMTREPKMARTRILHQLTSRGTI